MPRLNVFFLAVFSLFGSLAADKTPSPGIEWVGWTDSLFERATKEKKLVVLDLEAIWCHWCHVMEKETYRNPQVIALVREHFIAVRVDQDARPDLSKRYEDYGWPATIFFDPSGKELAKRSGFMDPKEFLTLTRRLVRHPLPEEGAPPRRKVADSPFLSGDMKKKLLAGHIEQYDAKKGGWGSVHKFLFGNSEELALRGAWRGKKDEAKRAKETLTKALVLVDPVWGGAYQYSVGGWKEPHFEKIARTQARNLFLYSLGFSVFQDAKYRKAAEAVRNYLTRFLKSPEGGFYTSQDADLIQGQHGSAYFRLGDPERRKLGIPSVDKHRYARENGWFVSGLCALYAATGDESVLQDAILAAQWVKTNRAMGKGGFRHDDEDQGGPYLGDTLEMGKAFLQLYEVTADRAWLKDARAAAVFVDETFGAIQDGKRIGFLPYSGRLAGGLFPEPEKDENIDVARFTNRLMRYTGDKRFGEMALAAMRFLASPEVAGEYPTAGVLLADEEVSGAPVHMTIVGSKKDPSAKALFKAALQYPTTYKRLEWWDQTEGDLPNQDVKYPPLKKPASFACTEGRCSLPIFEAKELRKKVDQLYR